MSLRVLRYSKPRHRGRQTCSYICYAFPKFGAQTRNGYATFVRKREEPLSDKAHLAATFQSLQPQPYLHYKLLSALHSCRSHKSRTPHTRPAPNIISSLQRPYAQHYLIRPTAPRYPHTRSPSCHSPSCNFIPCKPGPYSRSLVRKTHPGGLKSPKLTMGGHA